jgi:putative hemolysin
MIEASILVPILIILVILSGYFSGSETALFSLSPLRVKSYRTSNDPRNQLIANILRKPSDLLVTVFMFNTLINILIQNSSSILFGDSSSWLWKVGVPLVVTLVFGEIIPKTIGMQNNIAIAYYVTPSINYLHKMIRPIRKMAIAITAPISRILFFFLKKEESISSEEMMHVLDASEKHGVLHAEEAVLVKGYIRLRESMIKEVMWPREDIIFFEISEPLSKLEHLFVDLECTRIPICEETIDNVIGIMSARDYFLNRDQINVSQDLRKCIQKPFYIPETAIASNVLREFEKLDQVIGMAVDEYGTVTGLITSEDLIEIVIGDISDRRDQKKTYTIAGRNEIIASGKMELAEFNRFFETEISSDSGMVTLGGWLTEQLGDIPKAGVKYEWNDFLFQVLAADSNRIRRIYVRKGKEQIGTVV